MLLNPSVIVKMRAAPIATNTILALVTSDPPSSRPAKVRISSGSNSGESSSVKASLNVSAAVVKPEPIVPARSCPNRANATVTKELRFQRYVKPTSTQSMVVCSVKNARAISGEPANFCPVWFQRRDIRATIRMMTYVSVKYCGFSQRLRYLRRLVHFHGISING